MQIDFVNTLVILGSLQGFLLALVFLTHKKFKKKANMHLGIVIFVLSLINITNAFKSADLGDLSEFLDYLPLHWIFLVPFSLYYYIQYLVDPGYRFKKIEYALLFPFVVQTIYQIVVFTLYLQDSPLLITHDSWYSICNNYFEMAAIASTLLALILGIQLLNKHQKSLVETYSNIENQSLVWLKYTLYASLLLWLLWALPYAFGANQKSFYFPLYLGQAIITYWVGYFMYVKSDLFEPQQILDESMETQDTSPGLSERVEEHYQKLIELIETEKLFKNPDLSMSLLAGKMKLSNGYLSQIINQKEKKNFFDFINSYRIEEVKKNLTDPAYSHFSILGIGLEAGFKSKSTFNAVFKKMTGYTPSSYKKLLIAQQ